MSDGAVTMDIDALWRSMKASSIVPAGSSSSAPAPVSPTAGDASQHAAPAPPDEDAETITITHTYTFAGRPTTTTETVPRSSAKAKLWLAAQRKDAPEPVRPYRYGPDGQALYRPLRRVSPWEPNPDGVVANLPAREDGSADGADGAAGGAAGGKGAKGLRVVDKSKLGWHAAAAAPSVSAAVTFKAAVKAAKAPPKLNVVDKSKMDWREHVQLEGDREELDRAARSKGDYLERSRFLDRTQAALDESYARDRRK